jgi:hypothetical protein
MVNGPGAIVLTVIPVVAGYVTWIVGITCLTSIAPVAHGLEHPPGDLPLLMGDATTYDQPVYRHFSGLNVT